MGAVWQQVLALDARYNAYRAPNNTHFRKFLFDILIIIIMGTGGVFTLFWQGLFFALIFLNTSKQTSRNNLHLLSCHLFGLKNL